MSEPRKRTREEVLAWLEERRKHPLYVKSIEYEGMSLSFVNPELVEDEDTDQDEGEKG